MDLTRIVREMPEFSVFFHKVEKIPCNPESFLVEYECFHRGFNPKEVLHMAKSCEICQKRAAHGNNVSHSNRKTKRTWAPNIQHVRVIVDGTPCTRYVCTKCLRSGKVERAL